MCYPLKKQLNVVFIIFIAVVMFLCWSINAFLLGTIYQEWKKRTLIQTYEMLAHYAELNELESENFTFEMQRICDTNNINYIILDKKLNIITTSVNEEANFRKQLCELIEGADTLTTMSEEQPYVIEQIFDSHNQMEFVALWGSLGDEQYFMLRTSVEGIRPFVRIASIFMLIVCACILLIACLVINVIAKKISDPIMELAHISKKMAELDFETKYHGNSKNEIAILGSNFNEMSEKLEKTIGDLKTANMELQKDVANRDRIDKARKEFIDNVSHEFKTPIALIQGYAEGLQEGIIDDPESLKYYCDVIMDETKRMNKFVLQLLTLSQLESGGEPNEMQRFDIVGVINNCISADCLLAKQDGINVVFDMKEPVFVWADEFKIEHVVRNYFSNAIHYCESYFPNGKKEIHITVEKKDEVARVAIFNTGKQIPEQEIPHVWEKFYKIDKARTRSYGGTGIGLSVVKAIMDSHQQNYGVINRESGVEFWFELSMK